MGSRKPFIGAGLLLALLVSFVPAKAEELEDLQAQRVSRVIEHHVLPGIAVLHEAANKLPDAVAQVCVASTSVNVKQLRDAFSDAAMGLAAVDFYRFGPMAEQGRRERLAFWPDPRGVMARQLRAIVAAADPAVATSDGIARQSAAVQGLPALESLIADTSAPLGPEQSYRCLLARAIAGNIAALTRDLRERWMAADGQQTLMRNPGATNPTYKTHAEAAADLVKSLLTGLQVVSELQLKPRIQAPKGSNGPYAKLGLQREVYTAAVGSLSKLYGLLDLEAPLKPEKSWIKGWVTGAWRAMGMSDGMGGPAAGVPAADAPRVQEVVSRIGGLRMLIGKEMSNAAGIAIGFNELDGD